MLTIMVVELTNIVAKYPNTTPPMAELRTPWAANAPQTTFIPVAQIHRSILKPEEGINCEKISVKIHPIGLLAMLINSAYG